MKIKNGDTVFIRSGKDKGRKGKVIKTLPKQGKIVVDGINVKKKHVRPRKQGEKGQVAQIPSPFFIFIFFGTPFCKKMSNLQKL